MLYRLYMYIHVMHVGGAESREMVFSKSMSNEDFVAFLKQKGLMEPDCKKLSGTMYVVPYIV